MIGELLATVTDDTAVLERIGGPIGEAARDAAGELAALPPSDARGWRTRLVAAVRAPVPPGIRGVDPTWIEAGLVGLPARARMAVSGPRDPVDVWLARWACAAIPPLPAIDHALEIPGSIEDAIRLSAGALVEWLAEVAADQLAHALSSQPAALGAIARITGDRVLAAADRIPHPPRAGALGPIRDAIVRCRAEATGRELLLRIGARAIGPHTDPMTRRQLAVRLPRPLGLTLADEMLAHATTPLDRAPTWAALGAVG